jgi:hypothetical protein
MGILSERTQRKKSGVTPVRLIVYGPPKVGKTRFACEAPKPYVLSSEDGITDTEVPFFRPNDMTDVYGLLRELSDEPHDYKTLVIDSLDWIEPLLYADLCRKKNWKSIPESPFRQGYGITHEAWREMMVALENLQKKRGMHLIMVAHPQPKTITNASGADYTKTCLKLLESKECNVSQLLVEWATAVGYARFDISTQKDDGSKFAKATTDGPPVLCFGPAVDFECGSRYPLPSEMPLSWKEFWKHHVGSMPVGETEAREGLKALKLTPEERAAVDKLDDINKIKQVYNRLKEKYNV